MHFNVRVTSWLPDFCTTVYIGYPSILNYFLISYFLLISVTMFVHWALIDWFTTKCEIQECCSVLLSERLRPVRSVVCSAIHDSNVYLLPFITALFFSNMELLKFRGPYIVIYSYNKTKDNH